ncbi:MAG: [acyl-carrier-protein] S-malonyltransferase [Gemmatimonadetes bacterium GWC2_71_10]|nr:MAG: [acyl-carrier-protein] S-malonyltransferase [Gemmatimonadetes bacterium GWC2_71_10]
MNVALLCPGQGAQKVGMGKDLAEAFSAARDTFAAIDAALGIQLSRVMWEGPDELLTRTDHAQPAILAHSAAVWAVVAKKLAGRVAAAAGHSLGEYSAYVAAGLLTPEDAALLVRRRGELMNDAGQARPGSMAAVLGLATERVTEVCASASRAQSVVVAANLNAPDQTVISGDPDAVTRAGESLKAAGAKRVIPLKVSGAFHSPLMAPAREGLTAALTAAPAREPAFPVVANATAQPVRDAATARVQLAAQLTSPVRWVECTRRLHEIASAGGAPTFVEIGPGNVLTGLAKRIVPGVACVTLGTAPEVRAFLEAA